jgi:hypothetical protein
VPFRKIVNISAFLLVRSFDISLKSFNERHEQMIRRMEENIFVYILL